jgi:hypothetical protein
MKVRSEVGFELAGMETAAEKGNDALGGLEAAHPEDSS